MRKRFTALMEMSEPDMKAFLELVARYGIEFTMSDAEPEHHTHAPPQTTGNGKPEPTHTHKEPYTIEYPKQMIVRIDRSKSITGLPVGERHVLEALNVKYGEKPFRKGDASVLMQTQCGTGASSHMTHLCRKGHLVPTLL